MCISLLPEKMLDKSINKAFTKAMQKATTPEQKQKLMDMRKEMLSLDKKAKKLKLKALIKNAPQKDIAAAEMKLKAELKKSGKIQESVLFEDEPAVVPTLDTATADELYNMWLERPSGQTNAGAIAANNTLGNVRLWAIIATVVSVLLFSALVAIVVHNIRMGMDSY